MTKIYMANDHAGFEMKCALCEWAESEGHEVVDLGSDSTESVDYPDYATEVAKALKEDRQAFGVLICGTGIGMSIAANRYKHILAALCHTVDLATSARTHNHANVLCLGTKVVDTALAVQMLETFLKTEPLGDRHQRRVNKMTC